MDIRQTNRQGRTLPLFAAMAIACTLLGGCYKRVVGVQGPGSDAYDVYEPNLKEPVENPYTEPTKVESKKYQGK